MSGRAGVAEAGPGDPMLIVVLIAFVVALTLIQPPIAESLLAPSWITAVAAAAYLLLAAALTAANTASAVRRLKEGGGVRRKGLLAAVLSGLEQFWLIGGLGLLIFAGYGQWAMFDLRVAGTALVDLPLLSKLVVLAPFVVAVALCWLIDYPLHRAIRQRVYESELAAGRPAKPPWTRGQYLAYNFRHHLLFVAAPVLLILLVKDLFTLYAAPVLEPALGVYADLVLLGAILLVAGGVFLTAPLMLVRIWHTQSMPDGPLRRELDQAMARMHLRCRDILIWKSDSAIANAGVMGLVGRFRYVLLSDLLLENIDLGEIKAIFAHEAGHIVHHHIFYSALFAFTSVGLCGAAGDVIHSLAHEEWLAEVATLALLALAWWLGFGFISRRFERQSDVVGAWLASRDFVHTPGDDLVTLDGALTFARALERVAALNGIAPGHRNWRHGSISDRIQYILDLARHARSRQGIDRVVRRVKLMLWALAFLAVAIVSWQLMGA